MMVDLGKSKEYDLFIRLHLSHFFFGELFYPDADLSKINADINMFGQLLFIQMLSLDNR